MFKSAYSEKKSVKMKFTQKSLTQQHNKDECDINNIVAKLNATGVLEHVERRSPRYLDCMDPMEYSEALNVVIEAQEQFDSLPAKIRERFGNDPEAMLDFLSCEENYEEAKALGFVYEDGTSGAPQTFFEADPKDDQNVANQESGLAQK